MDEAAATATMEEAVRLLLQENPAVDPALACAIVQFNWDRGVRDLEGLVGIEQYANAFADGD